MFSNNNMETEGGGDVISTIDKIEKELLSQEKDENESVIDKNKTEKVARKSIQVKYVYVVAVIIPILTFLSTFFTIPKKAKRQEKNKRYMIAGAVVLGLWIALGLLVYFKRNLLDYGIDI